ncbi:helix-turn-helix transcriptional regulator [uncultured Dokdonia sp.]|uniref:helix-turn-helix domain-containing protein n=1 Tax=uncultured Dokdonia sp. TaxID=575653 RepID=UPI0026087B30|nr:helix-turn-helix transcriptional regulator [uncultured Dokdonia sp.]
MSTEIENIVFSRFVSQPIPFEIITIAELYERCRKSTYDLSVVHRIEFHALLIVNKGNSTHTIDFKEYKLFPGMILPLTKGQVHAFAKECTLEGYVISFEESFITQNSSEKHLFHFLHLYHEPSIHIGAENLSSLHPYLEILSSQLNNDNQNVKSDFIHSAFMTLLLHIKRLSFYQHKTFESKRFKDFLQFKQLLIEYHKESHNAKEYAQKMKVSYKYLNDICKEIANKTAKSFIDNWLLLEIKRNISDQLYTSQEIAYTMGFKEHSNFIRFFKKFTGTTPSKYQN